MYRQINRERRERGERGRGREKERSLFLINIKVISRGIVSDEIYFSFAATEVRRGILTRRKEDSNPRFPMVEAPASFPGGFFKAGRSWRYENCWSSAGASVALNFHTLMVRALTNSNKFYTVSLTYNELRIKVLLIDLILPDICQIRKDCTIQLKFWSYWIIHVYNFCYVILSVARQAFYKTLC